MRLVAAAPGAVAAARPAEADPPREAAQAQATTMPDATMEPAAGAQVAALEQALDAARAQIRAIEARLAEEIATRSPPEAMDALRHRLAEAVQARQAAERDAQAAFALAREMEGRLAEAEGRAAAAEAIAAQITTDAGQEVVALDRRMRAAERARIEAEDQATDAQAALRALQDRVAAMVAEGVAAGLQRQAPATPAAPAAAQRQAAASLSISCRLQDGTAVAIERCLAPPQGETRTGRVTIMSAGQASSLDLGSIDAEHRAALELGSDLAEPWMVRLQANGDDRVVLRAQVRTRRGSILTEDVSGLRSAVLRP